MGMKPKIFTASCFSLTDFFFFFFNYFWWTNWIHEFPESSPFQPSVPSINQRGLMNTTQRRWKRCFQLGRGGWQRVGPCFENSIGIFGAPLNSRPISSEDVPVGPSLRQQLCTLPHLALTWPSGGQLHRVKFSGLDYALPCWVVPLFPERRLN